MYLNMSRSNVPAINNVRTFCPAVDDSNGWNTDGSQRPYKGHCLSHCANNNEYEDLFVDDLVEGGSVYSVLRTVLYSCSRQFIANHLFAAICSTSVRRLFDRLFDLLFDLLFDRLFDGDRRLVTDRVRQAHITR